MALHLVVHIVLVRAEEKKGPKIDVTFGWEERGGVWVTKKLVTFRERGLVCELYSI